MNKQKKNRLFKYMDELNDMLIDIEWDVRKAGYFLEYEIQQLGNLICSVREGLAYYFEHGIDDEEG